VLTRDPVSNATNCGICPRVHQLPIFEGTPENQRVIIAGGQYPAACWTVIACGFADARIDVAVQTLEPCPAPRCWSDRAPCDGFACRRSVPERDDAAPAAGAPPVLVRVAAERRAVVAVWS